jgi:hypothetical protein
MKARSQGVIFRLPKLFVITFIYSALSSQLATADALKGHVQINLWPGTPPDAQHLAGPEYTKTVTDEPVAGKP